MPFLFDVVGLFNNLFLFLALFSSMFYTGDWRKWRDARVPVWIRWGQCMCLQLSLSRSLSLSLHFPFLPWWHHLIFVLKLYIISLLQHLSVDYLLLMWKGFVSGSPSCILHIRMTKCHSLYKFSKSALSKDPKTEMFFHKQWTRFRCDVWMGTILDKRT